MNENVIPTILSVPQLEELLADIPNFHCYAISSKWINSLKKSLQSNGTEKIDSIINLSISSNIEEFNSSKLSLCPLDSCSLNPNIPQSDYLLISEDTW